MANILSNPIEYLKGVGPQRAELLKKELNIFTFKDLLELFPYRHVDRTRVSKVLISLLNLNTFNLQGDCNTLPRLAKEKEED